MTSGSSKVLDTLDKDPNEARAWLATLAGLLSKCEYYRSEINGRHLGSDAALVLNRAEMMVFAAEDLAKVTTFPDRLEDQQVEGRASRSYSGDATGIDRRRLHRKQMAGGNPCTLSWAD